MFRYCGISVLASVVVLGMMSLELREAAATPGIINYQAKLTGPDLLPLTGSHSLTFTFWDAASGGNQLGAGFSDVDVVTPGAGGVVSTTIGDEPGVGIPSSVFASDSAWLNVNVDGTDLVPRERITAVGYAINAFPNYGPGYIVPEVTADATTNGLNLLAAYARAKVLSPHGQPLSATNRAAVLIAPGRYDLGTTEVLLDTEFVDLIGLSSNRDNQYILGESGGPNSGVIAQTANDVHVENVLVECTRSSGGFTAGPTAPAAYFPNSDLAATVIKNCDFRANEAFAVATRFTITYSGAYSLCKVGNNAFGALGVASGTFTDCVTGVGGFGELGTASGIFVRCVSADSGFGNRGTASGKFYDCTAGNTSFGGLGTASGEFHRCIGGEGAFGGYGVASGTFTDCTANIVGFGGMGSATGQFINCNSGTNSFGGMGSDASGTFISCVGADDSFGAGAVANGGKFTDCSGGPNSFSFSPSSPAPVLRGCKVDGAPWLDASEASVVAPVTADPVLNGARLVETYNYAKTLLVNGVALSSTNRMTVFVPPGMYDLGSAQLALDTEYVDVVGQSSSRNDQYVFGTSNGPDSGVLRQTASDVHIENLLVECTRHSGGASFNSNGPAAYFPDSNSTGTVIRNCEFKADSGNAWSTRVAIDYQGTYSDVVAYENAFGTNGTASGVFTNCSAGTNSFGGSGSGNATGVFTNCTGGASAFGGTGLSATGTFTNCTGGDSAFLALSAGGGKFLYCRGGVNSFTTGGSPLVLYCVRNGVAYP